MQSATPDKRSKDQLLASLAIMKKHFPSIKTLSSSSSSSSFHIPLDLLKVFLSIHLNIQYIKIKRTRPNGGRRKKMAGYRKQRIYKSIYRKAVNSLSASLTGLVKLNKNRLPVVVLVLVLVLVVVERSK